ncbi:hypothetical protein [Ectothiorhodospira lacustris]|uniref:hypothetical protein n=1 Tax=Ectothiorhodospira lacustris TaxID=2899127 RepID=UPI001EE9A052|nr:hypothetical protein [Ectothiorhodospira lacustris]MCG5500685.1 hypothetical protein [Ectothiorhodospira lacustris]MCG5509929.1 hypothetical protein [Ectothiorhodospira lacustris]MCG5521183.1 hypothetical protein [Ectothiorhodospira lacustris]
MLISLDRPPGSGHRLETSKVPSIGLHTKQEDIPAERRDTGSKSLTQEGFAADTSPTIGSAPHMQIDRADHDDPPLQTRPSLAADLLDGLIAYRKELGRVGEDLEHMLRAAGIRPSSPWIKARAYRYRPPPR